MTDGLKGMSDALGAIYPQTMRQTCIVHLSRHSLEYASGKERKAVAPALRPIYTAPTAEQALDAFERSRWGARFPTVVAAWRRAWTHVLPFFAFAPEIRRVLYTTNALESAHARLRKIIKTRGHFPNDKAATKLLWLMPRVDAHRQCALHTKNLPLPRWMTRRISSYVPVYFVPSL